MNSGVVLKLILFAISVLINPVDFFKFDKVAFVFLAFKMLTYTLQNLKSGVVFTSVILISPVILGFFKS